MNSKKQIFIKAAGFIVRVVFEECEVKTYQDEISKGILRIWGENKLVQKAKSRYDFSIRFVWPDEAKLDLIQKVGGVRNFLLTYERDFKARVFRIYYHSGLQVFDALLREAYSYLLSKEKGFLLHGASCMDKRSLLHVFMARKGGGKSTLKNILEKVDFMHFSDDMLIIKKEKDWNSYSPPFIEKETLPNNLNARALKFYFVKKTKKPKIKKLSDKSEILKKTLEQIWLREPEINKELLGIAAEFVEENEFYNIGSTLNSKKMKGLINEA